MVTKQWKYLIKQQCIEGGVYEPCCDRLIENLADLMYTLQDFKELYDEAKKKGKYEEMSAYAIRKADLHSKCMIYWRELMLTPKEYRAFLENNGETKKENKLVSLILADKNAESE